MLATLWQYIIKPALFLLFMLTLGKAAFLLFNTEHIQGEDIGEIFQVFTNSFSLDLAILSYLLFVPTILLSVQLFTKKNRLLRSILIFYYVLISVVIYAINVIDIELFSYWSSKLSAKALSYLNTPGMAIASAGKFKFFLFILSIGIVGIIFRHFFNRIILRPKITFTPSFIKVLLPLALIGILILGLRGGLREIPINQSEAYFSSNHVLNVAGVNSLWNAGNVLFQNTNNLTENPYKTMSEAKAEEIFNKVFTSVPDSTQMILNTKRPNIVFIAMEGVNANCIQGISQQNDYMPNVSALMKQGYSFSQMYASGMRTDQGLVAVISGFPALPLHTIGAQPEKFQHLPSLSLALQEQDYENKFFFAGEPEFGSFKAFLIHNGFEKVYSLKDFTKKELSQDLGAPDEHLFQKFIDDMQSPKEPFFSMIMTQTTHEPFDMPFNEGVDDDATKYVNTVKYLDSIIGNWYNACQDLSWFENTIFVLTSDHSHTFPERYWYTDPERFHIPFMLFGPALKEEFKGQENHQIVNQSDIPLSLAKQLELKKQEFTFSKDIFNPYSPTFTTFIHIHGHNWIDQNGHCFINYEIENDFQNPIGLDSCTLRNAAYFQHVFQTYMSY